MPFPPHPSQEPPTLLNPGSRTKLPPTHTISFPGLPSSTAPVREGLLQRSNPFTPRPGPGLPRNGHRAPPIGETSTRASSVRSELPGQDWTQGCGGGGEGPGGEVGKGVCPGLASESLCSPEQYPQALEAPIPLLLIRASDMGETFLAVTGGKKRVLLAARPPLHLEGP